MSDQAKATQDVVNRALAAYRKAGGQDEARMRTALHTALEGDFAIGDEVICHHGSLVGVIIEIHNDQAVISWSTRGKSMEPVTNLEHVEHFVPD